jgi:hypothetical protein
LAWPYHAGKENALIFHHGQNADHGIPVPDYVDENVSTKVVKIITELHGHCEHVKDKSTPILPWCERSNGVLEGL